MMKKVWSVLPAVVLVFGLVAIGCGSSSSGSSNPEEEYDEVVVFTLSKEIAKMVDAGTAVGTQLNTADNSTTFNDYPMTNAGDLIIKIVANGEAYAFEFETTKASDGTTGINWGAGLDLKNSAIKFKTGDVIDVAGTIIEEFPGAPGGGDSWATPMVYLACDPGASSKTVEQKSPEVGPFTISYTLTATNINEIARATPPNIRIGGRPGKAKFSVEEITVTRKVPKTPAATYTVTFLDTDKTTELGKVTGIEKDLLVPASTTSETWYTTFMAGIPAGKEFDDWYNLADDSVFKLSANTVSDNISLYAVLVDVEALPAGFTKLGEPEDGKTWYTNGRDGKTTTLTAETLKGAKYLIIKAISVEGQNGFGTIQPALQSTTFDNDGWKDQSISGGWNKPEADKDQWDIAYNTEDTFYIVIDLTALPFWSGFVSSTTADTKAKILLNNKPSQIEIDNAYLADTTVTLSKPATAYSLNGSYGWAQQAAPGGL